MTDCTHTTRFAFWLLPEKKDERLLRRQIDAYAAKLGSPRFTPHLTLLALPEELVPDPLATLERLAALTGPLHLATSGRPEWGSVYNQAFLLPFTRSEALERLVSSLHPMRLVPENYYPHLSLIYANLSEKQGRRLVQQAELFQHNICFDKMAVIAIGPSCRCDADVRMWEQVAMLELQS